MRPRAVALFGGIAALLSPSRAPAASAAPPPVLTEEQAARIEIAPSPPPGKAASGDEGAFEQPTENQEPPRRPRRRGLVVESTLGVLGFGGRFGHVAPPAYWLHGHLGYEILPFLMLFGEAEVALTDTSESLDESHVRAFAMWGWAGGVRATVHATERVAFYAQGGFGELAADVPHNALGILGFPNAESLHPAFGGRIGVEWYQIDRHVALCAAFGERLAQGFSKVGGQSDVPAIWDFGAGFRYTF